MGVHVDGPNALSIDDNFTSLLRRLRQRRAHQTGTDKRKTCQRARSMAEYFSSVCHYLRCPIDTPKLPSGFQVPVRLSYANSCKRASSAKSYSIGTKIECRILPSTC